MTIRKGSYDLPLRGRRRGKNNNAINEIDYTKLARKLRIMDNDRSAYAQEMGAILRKQGHEIDALGKENDSIHHELSVAYGPRQLNKDVDNAKALKELLEVREDYDRLIAIETASCNELDRKINNLRDQMTSYKRSMGGEDSEQVRRLNQQRSVSKLENQVNKNNHNLRLEIELCIKEKKIYEDLYRRVTDKIFTYKHKIMAVTKEASTHYEQRLEAMAKMKTLKERSHKDETAFQSERKILQRMVAHDTKLKEFMDTKENERLLYKAEEAEKRAKMSVKEKALTDESQYVQKYEELFQNVKGVTGHKDLDKVVVEFTTKDEENFARFDYVSELNHDVEKIRDNIKTITDNIKKLKSEDEKAQTGSEKAIWEHQVTRAQLTAELIAEETKLKELNDKVEDVCATVHLLFKRINCSTNAFKTTLAFEDKVTMENLKVYLSLIEQRCMELICILKFISLHQDQNENLLKSPRSIHRIRPRGPSKILLEIVDKPVMPNINIPSISDEPTDVPPDTEEPTLPLDIGQLRDIAMGKIAKKEAAGLLNSPLFVQQKKGKPKPKK